MPHAVNGLKVCTGCHETLPVRRFSKQAALRDGLNPKCKACKQAIADLYYQNNREAIQAAQGWKQIKHKYGLTREDYEVKLAAQGGVCAICQKPDLAKGHTRLCVDHNHETGEVRGLLCVTCNLAIGYLKDDIGLLGRAADYLREWS